MGPCHTVGRPAEYEMLTHLSRFVPMHLIVVLTKLHIDLLDLIVIVHRRLKIEKGVRVVP